jgi:hypothetical protein
VLQIAIDEVLQCYRKRTNFPVAVVDQLTLTRLQAALQSAFLLKECERCETPIGARGRLWDGPLPPRLD